jgi:hypothetical protein
MTAVHIYQNCYYNSIHHNDRLEFIQYDLYIIYNPETSFQLCNVDGSAFQNHKNTKYSSSPWTDYVESYASGSRTSW